METGQIGGSAYGGDSVGHQLLRHLRLLFRGKLSTVLFVRSDPTGPPPVLPVICLPEYSYLPDQNLLISQWTVKIH